MFGSTKGEDQQSTSTETIIGSGIRVDGKFIGKGSVLVQGEVAGSVKTKENVTVAEGTVVHASVEAKNVHVAGLVQGNIKAREHLELSATARVQGDVEAGSLAIQTGALLSGRCLMTFPETHQPAQHVSDKPANEEPKDKQQLQKRNAAVKK